ncbi:hypothetical protein GJ496_011114 [Pomphorhynchus laevis]|nr:hypothetical protein GJ496_011114 [Pomphorhynchus laevis]
MVRIQLNTGAAATKVSKDIWYRIGRPNLRPIRPLCAFGGSQIAVLEECNVNRRIVNGFGLRISPNKCHFGQKEIDFLGVHIANGIITLNEDKLYAINHLQIPRNKSELKSSLGMVTDIKDALRHPVSLTPYRLDKPLILTCDASNAGLGAALCHDINGDSRDLRTMTNTRMIRWALHLSRYNYTIKYIEGKDNVYADILSRSPTATRNVTVKQTYDLDNEDNILVVQEEKLDQIELSSHELQKASHTDTQLRRITRYVRFGWPSKVQDIDKTFGFRRNELSYENGILMFQQRIVIPEALHRCVLRILHEGHSGEVTMKTYARYYVWWPKLDNDIHNYVASCYDCQIMRPAARELPLYNWDVPCKPWHRIYLDFAGPKKCGPKYGKLKPGHRLRYAGHCRVHGQVGNSCSNSDG